MTQNLKDVSNKQIATFSGGCFWCIQPAFDKLKGVIEVIVGYAGGKGENPTYEDYAKKGYVEAVQITYNPSMISYGELIDVFWQQIDPTDVGGQFVDRGPQYRSIIFYHNDEQKEIAQKSKENLEKLGKFSKSISTEIIKYSNFYSAENYHQDYSKKNPVKYNVYRYFSGRDKFINKYWKKESNFKKPADEVLHEILTPIQYDVTQKDKTEKPFENKYWDNKKPGIYVDIVSGEPLFSSLDKFDSGTGWPSFTKPIESKNIIQKKEQDSYDNRIEVRSKNADSHLGHVFEDGPKPTGLRYCVNSAALRFIPLEDLEKEGYGEYKKLFEKN